LKDFGFFGPLYGWIFSNRTWYKQRTAYQERKEQELRDLKERFRNYVTAVRSLKDISIVASPLVWNDGYPLGGASALSRWIDSGPLAPRAESARGASGLLWFQAAGNTRGQCWHGMFRDDDGNGAMEFAG